MISNQAERHIPEIVERLKQIDPVKVILFGSTAGGSATEASDLDLLIVTRSNQIPVSHREMENVYLEVARLLRDIRKEIPIDLIVHTQPMHDKFLELGSMFAREVLRTGVVLYESHHP